MVKHKYTKLEVKKQEINIHKKMKRLTGKIQCK